MTSRLDSCDDDGVRRGEKDGRIHQSEEKVLDRRITSATPPRQSRQRAKVACEGCRVGSENGLRLEA